MKKILVPTDFSPNALCAAHYAAKLAQEHNYGLHIFHCYTALSSTFEEESLAQEFKDSSILKADLTIVEFVTKIQTEFPALEITYENTRGLLAEVLPREAKKEGYACIIMGTTGSSAEKNSFWGSNTTKISSNSPIPIFAIPQQTTTYSHQKVGLLTNFKQEELISLKEYMHISGGIAELLLMHVYKETQSLSEIMEELETWKFNIQEFTNIQKIDYLIAPINKEDKNLDTIPEVISNLIEEHDLALIVVSKSRKSFFKRLFKNSVSTALTLKLEIPAFFGKTAV